MGSLFSGGSAPGADQLTNLANQAAPIGFDQVGAASSGKGTPFQQSLVKGYVKGATDNFNSYLAASGGSAAGMGTDDLVNQQSQVMLQSFLNTDFQTGLQALGLAGGDYAQAAGIAVQGAQATASAVSGAASLVGSIMAMF